MAYSPRQHKDMVNSFLHALISNSFPLHPQLKHVILTSALQRHVSCVVRDVVVFVLLEQVLGSVWVTILQNTLQNKTKQNSVSLRRKS